MARSTYGSAPDGWQEHDKLLLETQKELLRQVKESDTPGMARGFAEAYALISGHITTQRIEVKNG